MRYFKLFYFKTISPLKDIGNGSYGASKEFGKSRAIEKNLTSENYIVKNSGLRLGPQKRLRPSYTEDGTTFILIRQSSVYTLSTLKSGS